MVDREEVEALRARVLREADNAAGRGVRLADMTFSVEGDTLAALCRAWLAVDGAPTVTLEWSDFNRGLFIDDSRATAFEWEQRLIGQRVRVVSSE